MQQKVSRDAKQADRLATAMAAECLGVRIGRLHRLVGRRFDQELRPLGLSIPQLEVLSALVLCAEPVKPSDLAGWLSIERSTMSRNLALMEQKGLVETTETSPTGRSLRVAVTAAGVQTLAQAKRAWQTAQQSVCNVLGEQAVPILDTWLAGLANDGNR